MSKSSEENVSIIFPCTGRIWHKVRFFGEFNRFQFRVFLFIDCLLSQVEEPTLPYYLLIAGGRIIGFIPCYVKCNQPCPRFEPMSLCPFPTTITITPQPPQFHKRISFRNPSLFHQKCLSCLIRLTEMVCEIGDEWQYNSFWRWGVAACRICSKETT